MEDEITPQKRSVAADSVRVAMDQAWRDHHHARDQTWKAVQIEAVLAAGLVGVDVQLEDPAATLGAAALVVIATLFGVMISLRHRKLEILKFTHIMNCQKWLGLLDLITDVAVPEPIRIWHILYLWRNNTALFILRMHVAIMLFAVIFAYARWPF